jgi:uncharacterized protein YecT (DUF1311 family)
MSMTKWGCASLALVATLSLPVVNAQTQLDLDRRAGETLAQLSRQLDATVANYRARLSGDKLQLFDRSQAVWVQFRKAACAFQSSGAAGGSVQPMVSALCYADYTRNRLQELKYLSTCEEGDVSCPAWSAQPGAK